MRTAATTDPQRAVVVLGAGRSGTSAITRALPALGVELGGRLRRGSGKNPTGFFEDLDLLALNKRLRSALGIESDSVRLIDESEWHSPAIDLLKEEAVATIRRRFGGERIWGYKYGRTLRLLPFWREVYCTLDLDVAYVLAIRNPLSVARSRARLDPTRGTQEKSDLEWLVNVVPYLRLVKERPFVVVDYDRVVANAPRELERMAARLSLPVTQAVRTAIDVYANEFLQPPHSGAASNQGLQNGNLHPLVRRAYGWLDALAGDEVSRDDAALWNDWECVDAELRALAPLLIHIDRLEHRLRRAERSPLGPLQAVPHLWRYLRSK